MGKKARASALTLSALIGVILIGFQNCTGYQGLHDETDFEDSLVDECGQFGACSGPDSTQLQILVNNNPLIVLETDRSVDIAGYCDSAGFKETRIYYGIENVTGLTRAPQGCDENGRFRFLLTFPTNFNYDQRSILVVSLRGVNDAGEDVPHPSIPNQQRVQIINATPP